MGICWVVDCHYNHQDAQTHKESFHFSVITFVFTLKWISRKEYNHTHCVQEIAQKTLTPRCFTKEDGRVFIFFIFQKNFWEISAWLLFSQRLYVGLMLLNFEVFIIFSINDSSGDSTHWFFLNMIDCWKCFLSTPFLELSVHSMTIFTI